MEHSITHQPSFALLQIDLEADESIMAEAGAMVSHTDGIEISTNRGNGGLFGAVKRTVLGSESFFQNTFTAKNRGHVTLAPPIPGDITRHDLTGGSLYVQSGSYLAADPSITIDTQFGGAKTFFGGEGLFLLELSGTGPAFLSSYGAIEEKTLDAGEQYTVDTGHIVAFEDSLEFAVNRVGGIKSTLFSGEGLVCTFDGPGRLWLQSRSQDAFLSWLIPQLPSDDN